MNRWIQKIEEKWPLFLIVAIIGGFLLFLITDASSGFSRVEAGTVVEKHYTPARHWTSVYVHTSKSGTFVTSQQHFVPESWNLTIRTPAGKRTTSVSSAMYRIQPIGNSVNIQVWLGKYTSWCYSIDIIF